MTNFNCPSSFTVPVNIIDTTSLGPPPSSDKRLPKIISFSYNQIISCNYKELPLPDSSTSSNNTTIIELIPSYSSKKPQVVAHIPATTSLTQGWYLNKILIFNQQIHKQYHSLSNSTPIISSTSGSSTSGSSTSSSSTSNNEIIGEIWLIHSQCKGVPEGKTNDLNDICFPDAFDVRNPFLVICIPIINTQDSNSSSAHNLERILKKINDDGKSNLNFSSCTSATCRSSSTLINNISLKDFVSQTSPFYIYNGGTSNLTIDNSLNLCNDNNIFIVFPPGAGIPIDSTNNIPKYLTSLYSSSNVNNLITNYLTPPPSSSSSVKLYLIQNSLSNNDEIYIDCQPVNESGEVYIPVQKSNPYLMLIEKLTTNLFNLQHGDLASALLGILVMLGLYFTIDNVFKIFKGVKAGKIINSPSP